MYGTLWISPDDFEKGVDSIQKCGKLVSDRVPQKNRQVDENWQCRFCRMYENSSQRLQKTKEKETIYAFTFP